MAEREFPANDQTPAATPVTPQPQERQKKVEKIEGLGSVEVKKPSLGQRMKKTFLQGDAKTAWAFVWGSVLVPTAKNMFLDAVQQGSERMVWGEARSRPSMGGNLSTQILGLGHQAYNKMYVGPEPARQQISAQARATHNFNEFVVGSRAAAEAVIDRMFDLLSRDGAVTVADFYDLIGADATYTDQKWGWVDLRGSQVVRVPQGYLMDLPRPIQLD